MQLRYRGLLALFASVLLVPPAVGQQRAYPLPSNPHSADSQSLEASGVDLPTGPSSPLASTASPDAALIASIVSKVWDVAAGDWQDESRTIYTRNSTGIILEQLNESYDTASGSWMGVFRTTSTVDDRNFVTESVSEGWDEDANGGSGGWVPAQRNTYTRNDQGNPLVSTTEYWDDGSQDYFIYNRTTYTYDASGTQRLTLTSESGLFGPLTPSLRYTFEFDGQGHTTRRIHERYETASGTWYNWGDRRWSHDSNGQETEDLELDWDQAANGGAGDWVNSFRTTTDYQPGSASATMVTETSERWNDASGEWEFVDRGVQEVTPNALMPEQVISTSLEWDALANGGLGDWVNVDRTVQDISAQQVVAVEQTWNGGGWDDEERSTIDLDGDGNFSTILVERFDGAWVNESLILYTWQDFSSTATEPEAIAAGFRLDANYPNPFTRSTTIDFTVPSAGYVSLDVFDLLGRRVATLVDGSMPPGTHEVTLEAGAMPPGLYVYRLESTGYRISRSMTIVR